MNSNLESLFPRKRVCWSVMRLRIYWTLYSRYIFGTHKWIMCITCVDRRTAFIWSMYIQNICSTKASIEAHLGILWLVFYSYSEYIQWLCLTTIDINCYAQQPVFSITWSNTIKVCLFCLFLRSILIIHATFKKCSIFCFFVFWWFKKKEDENITRKMCLFHQIRQKSTLCKQQSSQFDKWIIY